MNRKTVITLTSIAFLIVASLSIPNVYAEVVSLTVDVQTILLEPGQVIPLLDTKSVGNMTMLQVSATLPCDGSHTPKLKIIAGSLGNLTGVIDSSSDYDSLTGPFSTCYFSDMISPKSNLPILNKVFLKNDGSSSIVTNLGSVITLTGFLNQTSSSILDTSSVLDNSDLLAYYTFEENSTGTLLNHCSETGSTSCVSNSDGTPSGFVSADKVGGKIDAYSWNFDNSNNFVSLGNSIDNSFVSSGEVTLSFWYNATDLSSNDWILSQYSDASNRWDFVIAGTTSACGASGLHLYVNVQQSPDADSCSSDLSSWLTTNAWHHIVITHKDTENTLRFYVDGTLRSSVTNNNWFTAKTNTIYLCALNGDTTYLCNGRMDELSIWDKKLSDSEIQQLYDAGAGLSLLS